MFAAPQHARKMGKAPSPIHACKAKSRMARDFGLDYGPAAKNERTQR